MAKTYKGICYCGQMTFTATDVSDIWYCHCTQCRKMMGHYMSACGTLRENLSVNGEVVWTSVTENSSFGRCQICLSPMLWENKTQKTVSLIAGAFEDTDGLEVKGHIFIADKGTYYEITDGLPQYDGAPPGGVRDQE